MMMICGWSLACEDDMWLEFRLLGLHVVGI